MKIVHIGPGARALAVLEALLKLSGLEDQMKVLVSGTPFGVLGGESQRQTPLTIALVSVYPSFQDFDSFWRKEVKNRNKINKVRIPSPFWQGRPSYKRSPHGSIALLRREMRMSSSSSRFTGRRNGSRK